MGNGPDRTPASPLATVLVLLPVAIFTPIAASGGFRFALAAIPSAVLIALLLRRRILGSGPSRAFGGTPELGPFAGPGGSRLASLGWLALVWTSAAFGEEIVFRGVLRKNVRGIAAPAGFGQRSAGRQVFSPRRSCSDWRTPIRGRRESR